MKMITANSPWNTEQLYTSLKQKLNFQFKAARQVNVDFDIDRSGDEISISKSGLYEGFLFKLTVKGNDLQIDKSEHYVDDVNLLTLQNILDTLQMDEHGGADIAYISGE